MTEREAVLMQIERLNRAEAEFRKQTRSYEEFYAEVAKRMLSASSAVVGNVGSREDSGESR